MSQIVNAPNPSRTSPSSDPKIHIGTKCLYASELQKHLNIMPWNLTLRYDDIEFQNLAIECTDILQKIERGQVLIYSNVSKGIFNPLFIRLISLLPAFIQFIPMQVKFKFSPYLLVLINESMNHQHAWNQAVKYLPDYHYYLSAVYTRLVSEMIKCKAGLSQRHLKIKFKEQYANHSAIFNQLIKQHDQMNCLFIEVPYTKSNTLGLNLTEEAIERKFVATIEYFCTVLSENPKLKNKLANIQWRIVKSLDQTLAAHLVIYITGDVYDFQPLIHSTWQTTNITRALNISTPTVNCLLALHSYFNNGIAKKQWLNLIKCYQSPLEFYRYKANGVSFEWKSYTSNIYDQKSVE